MYPVLLASSGDLFIRFLALDKMGSVLETTWSVLLLLLRALGLGQYVYYYLYYDCNFNY